ncbi:hypothetical protein EST38_g8505 [Candolleomyces aberdarensis]|uniref:Uncharacterized protein n=1 Tax=Candolleomyces aberdarensis TaxID=2316362 RepID=A0A4Q2DF79_9AGAR|nr:hypothetical protein EST38_g8505 [Candolleomyces aberdarensis]
MSSIRLSLPFLSSSHHRRVNQEHRIFITLMLFIAVYRTMIGAKRFASPHAEIPTTPTTEQRASYFQNHHHTDASRHHLSYDVGVKHFTRQHAEIRSPTHRTSFKCPQHEIRRRRTWKGHMTNRNSRTPIPTPQPGFRSPRDDPARGPYWGSEYLTFNLGADDGGTMGCAPGMICALCQGYLSSVTRKYSLSHVEKAKAIPVAMNIGLKYLASQASQAQAPKSSFEHTSKHPARPLQRILFPNLSDFSLCFVSSSEFASSRIALTLLF